jgi:acetyl-CoA C-acetyltransferase
MVTGVGMHMTKHVAALYSTEPGPIRLPAPHHREQEWDAPPLVRDVPVVDRADGHATVLAATVVHGGDGAADHAVAICELPDGTRCYARSGSADTISAVEAGAWVTDKVYLSAEPDGTNGLHW